MSLTDKQRLEVEKLKKENKPLHDFLKENGIYALVSVKQTKSVKPGRNSQFKFRVIPDITL